MVDKERFVDNMFCLIHTYIHVLLKNENKNNFVDNYRIRKYINTGPLFGGLKNIEGGSI